MKMEYSILTDKINMAEELINVARDRFLERLGITLDEVLDCLKPEERVIFDRIKNELK